MNKDIDEFVKKYSKYNYYYDDRYKDPRKVFKRHSMNCRDKSLMEENLTEEEYQLYLNLIRKAVDNYERKLQKNNRNNR